MAIAPVGGAVATPICSTCGKPTVKIGEGTAPFAPPDLPGDEALPTLADQDDVVFSGNGVHPWRGNVTYSVEKNDAQQHVIVRVGIPGRPDPYVVRFHSSLLRGNDADALLAPPFGTSWHTLNTTSGQMNDVAAELSKPPTMDAQINFGLKLGNPGFGLIHIIAGHHQNLRTFTRRVAQIPDTPGIEDYRSYVALQAGLQECLGMSALQAIYQDTANINKWIFVGLSEANSVIVVTLRAGNTYSLTTFYIGAAAGAPAAVGGGQRKLAWKRRQARLPPGW